MTDLSFTKQSESDLRKLLDDLISLPYQKHNYDWLYFAKPNEKKGLYIMSKVIKHKGQKVFRTQLVKTKEDENDMSKLTLEEAFKRYQKRKLMSSYTAYFGANVDDKYKYNNILKYKEFDKLNYSEFVKKDYHCFIQAWVSIEKSEQYKEYVLDFLRSFCSTVRSNRKFVTHNYDEYRQYNQNEKFIAQNTFKDNQIKYEERQPTIEELKARLNLDKLKITTTENVDTFESTEEARRRKEEIIRGNKNLLKGIYPNVNTSYYQDVFKGMPNKYSNSIKSDYASSGIKGIIPEPYAKAYLKNTSEINDSLKTTIKSIMFG